MNSHSCKSGGAKMPKSTFYNLDQKKRDRIIEAATDEFAANSFHKASITNIIKNAEIASGSFYQYFDGKEDLYIHLLDIIVERKLEYIDQVVMRSPNELSFFTFLEKLYKGGIEFAKENPRLISMGKNLMNNNCEVCKKIREQQKPQSENFFKNILEQAIEAGDVKEDIDPELTAKFLTSINYSLSDFIYTEDGLNENVMDTINELIDIIENGIKN
jgi:AcrR family transcriptional regulator